MSDDAMDQAVRKFNETGFRSLEQNQVDVVLPSGAALHLTLPEVWFSYYHDDGRVWLFDVTKARAIGVVQRVARGTSQYLVVKELAQSPEEWLDRCRDLDTECAMQTDLTEPLTVVFIEGAHLLIDGSHRIYQALVRGVPKLFVDMIEDPESVRTVLIAELTGEAAEFCRRADL